MVPNNIFRSEPPTDPNKHLVECPACLDESDEATGDVLVQLPSGTWVRQQCELCEGFKKVDEKAVVLFLTQGASSGT